MCAHEALAEGRYTVADYLSGKDETPREVINGVILPSFPTPSIRHQLRVGRIAVSLDLALRRMGRVCEVLIGPVDVVFDESTVVQPDILVSCDPSRRVNGQYHAGAPNLVIEILSPGSATRDRRDKLALYERFGVPDYLIVDPLENYIEHYRLEEGRYPRPAIFGQGDELTLPLCPEQPFAVSAWLELPDTESTE